MPQPFFPQGKIPGAHLIWGWVSPRASQDIVEKNFYPAGNRSPIVQPIAHRYTGWKIMADHYVSIVFKISQFNYMEYIKRNLLMINFVNKA